ncbi:bifunctional DedA family/phosphatase PAP2 family protein [Inmirania thermothiophila]|uniref:Undecaprenyl-diphosphatase n=1 Tax=Inmirania thermothiophila TaxID=1750597 RepID=A0A3N1Y8C8_9GAMM|nr:bifunctional DedA family/phosphatase PAP2 family protein [Inmirania thermothiophila]ROR34791.1 undecaprenyl-diphosphatase [Inmirania thermothiophila]
MEHPALEALLAWIAAHPAWAGAVVFAAAFAESLVLVGLVVPGAVFMFAAGALVATGTVQLAPTWAAASAGALAGDLVSFWLGRRHGARLLAHRLLARRRELVTRAEAFVRRHGGKGVLVARFVGPLRPVVPALAGSLGMPWPRFAALAAAGAVAWAPAYLLPGIAVGASLALASEVAGRLVLLLALILGLTWGVFAAVHRLYARLTPRAARLAARLIAWSGRHPLLGPPVRALVDPERPDLGSLALLGPLLAGGVAGFAALAWQVARTPPPTPWEEALHRTLQGLRSPLVDHVMVALTELGDGAVLWPFGLGVLAWLLVQRRRTVAVHWALGLAFAFAVPPILKALLAVPRPPGAMVAGYAFPSGHATAAAAIYSLAAILAAPALAPAWRWLLYASTATLVLGIAASRLYLGVHWLGDVAAGLALGGAWAALVGLACRRHGGTPPRGAHLVAVSSLLLALFGGTHIALRHEADLARYAPRVPLRTLAPAAWLDGGWRALPAWRNDLGGRRRHPLTVQAAVAPAALARALAAQGWRPAPFRARDLLALLVPDPDPQTLPVLPQVHDGRHEVLRLALPAPGGRLVLRLWDAGWRLAGWDTPILVGNVSFLGAARPLPLLTLPRTLPRFDGPREVLARHAGALVRAQVRRGEGGPEWDGGVLLLAPPDITPPSGG